MNHFEEKLIRASQREKSFSKSDIIIGHNITASAINFTLRNQNKITAPSMFAVLGGMHKFGDITLIAGGELRKETISELKDCDIYSPRAPQFSFEVDQASVQAIVDRLNTTIDLEISKGLTPINGDAIANLAKDGIKNVNYHGTSTAMQLAYAKSKGHDIDLQMVQELPSRWSSVKSFTNIVEVLTEYKNSNQGFSTGNEDQMNHIRELLEKGYEEQKSLFGEDFKSPFSRYLYDRKARIEFRRMIQDLSRDIDRIGTRLDTRKLSDSLHEVAGAKSDYFQWLNDTFESTIGSPRIVQMDEYGSISHTPATPENLLKNFESRRDEGEGSHYGIGSVRAVFANAMDSDETMIANAHRILPENVVQKIFDDLDERFDGLLDQLEDYYNYGDASRDTIKEDITEVMASYDELGSSCLLEHFDEELVLDEEFAQEFDEFISDLRNAPSEYWEAKIYKNVDLSEFECAIVPSATPEALKSKLLDAGIKSVVTYEKGNNVSREAAIAKHMDAAQKSARLTRMAKIGNIPTP